MIKNYLKVALRNIMRHRGYSFINISGLAIGMACCILILFWIQDELSFDRFHENSREIYRVTQDINFADHSTSWAITQGPLGPSLEAEFPEITDSVRITFRSFRMAFDNNVFDETVAMADGSLLRVFTFPLLRGNPETVLSDPHSIVLSEEMAYKYFGSEDPVDKVIRADNQFDFKVTGILKKVPRNSHLRFEAVIPFVFARELNYSVDRWDNSSFSTYIRVQEGVSAQDVLTKISRFLDDKPTIEKDAALNLQPLARIHLHSRYDFDSAHGDITYVTIFSLVAFFILLIACINFMNLTTARSSNRAREVGMRKVAGAYRSDLVKQFFGESLILVSIALVLALLLVLLLLPLFNNLAAKEMTAALLTESWIWLGLLAITMGTGLMAGSYPAAFLSAFQPVRVLKGTLGSGARSSAFRKLLVVFQFSLTILLLICTLVVYTQLDFMRHKKLGYDKEHLLYFGMRGQMQEKYAAVKQELLGNPGVLAVGAGSNVPTYGYFFSNSLWSWDGKDPEEEVLMRAAGADVDFLETLGMEIVAGRSFSQDFSTDEASALIVNEAAVKAMRMADPVGQRLSQPGNPGTIVGVVKDYHFRSLRQKIDPLILIHYPEGNRFVFIRLKGEQMPRTIAYIESVWNKFAPGFDFRYRFLDEALDELYRAEQQTGTLFRYFSALAILISCLGLFGLASYLAEQRTKEIGIRKVLGATIANLVLLLSRDFTKWVLVSNLVAWPIAYFAMRQWLQSYAYRIDLPWWAFAVSGFSALAIAMITVSFQSIKAAVADPVDSLKYE